MGMVQTWTNLQILDCAIKSHNDNSLSKFYYENLKILVGTNNRIHWYTCDVYQTDTHSLLNFSKFPLAMNHLYFPPVFVGRLHTHQSSESKTLK